MGKIKKNKLAYASIVILIAIIAKVFQFCFLPQKYFYDSGHILGVMNGTDPTDKSFTATANFFKCINIFSLTDMYQWSVFLTIVATIILFIYLLRCKRQYTFYEYLFIYVTTFLLNIYVFNLSKEIIQILIFIACGGIISSRKIKDNRIKLLSLVILFILESLFFRVYYLILASLIPLVYYGLSEKKKNNPLKFFILIVVIFFIELFLASKILPDGYSQIITARSSVNDLRLSVGNRDANTMIYELFGYNKNFFVFIANYVADFIRLLLPVELLTKGLIYLPFVFYQISIVVLLIKRIKNNNIDSTQRMAISIIVCFLMVSAIFEPDFGSFMRHQCCVAPLLVFIGGSKCVA